MLLIPVSAVQRPETKAILLFSACYICSLANVQKKYIYIYKVGEDDERDARVNSPQHGRRLRGGKVTCRRETGRKETRRKEMGGKTNGSKERGVGETVANESGGGDDS